MNRLDSPTRIALRSVSPLGASLAVYPSDKPEAKRKRAQDVRRRQRAAGMTEIVLVLPKSCVDLIDAQKSRQGLRNRSQVVEQLFTRRSCDQQSP